MMAAESSWRHGDSDGSTAPSTSCAERNIEENRRERIMARVQREPVSLDALTKWAGRPTCGAVSSFLGITRDNYKGQTVLRLEYEGYESMAISVMQQISERVYDKWPGVCRIAMVHRVGVVPVGESSIAIAISSPHRVESLEAVHFAIDQVKALVPIWKKEIYGGPYMPDGDGAIGEVAAVEKEGDKTDEGTIIREDPRAQAQWKVNKEWDAAEAVNFSKRDMVG